VATNAGDPNVHRIVVSTHVIDDKQTVDAKKSGSPDLVQTCRVYVWFATTGNLIVNAPWRSSWGGP
jgi:hypothetical protein